MRQNLSKVQTRFKDRISVYELNIVDNRKWEDYDVISVPTLLYFNKGSEVGRLVGLAVKDSVETKALELLQ